MRECEPLTGAVIQASKTTAVRYERESPGELLRVDVKKIGKIPAGMAWKARGAGAFGVHQDQYASLARTHGL